MTKRSIVEFCKDKLFLRMIKFPKEWSICKKHSPVRLHESFVVNNIRYRVWRCKICDEYLYADYFDESKYASSAPNYPYASTAPHYPFND